MKPRILLVVGFVLALLATSLPLAVTGQSSDTPTPPPGAMLTLTADAIIRSWPKEDAEQVGKLPAGSAVETNGRLEDSSWWQVPYPGGPNGNGWLPASDVQPNAAAAGVTVYALPTVTPTPSGAAMVTLTTDGTVMSWPDDNANQLGKLPAGSSVPTNGRLEDSSWWQVPYPGGPNGNGWLPASEVQPDAAAAEVTVYEVVVPTPEAPPVAPTPPACQFNSAYVTDVTIPDGTEIQAAQSFDKVWRVENSGTCPWGPGTVLNFIGGIQMSAPPTVTVPSTAPGETADIGVTMFAPSTPGVHNSIWQLEDQGQLFGTKVNALIHVPGSTPPTAAPPPSPPPPPTGVPQPSISFSADTDRVSAGQCTNLHWNVQQAQAVYLEYQDQKRPVSGQDSQQVCPSTDGKRYTLHVIGQDGQQHTSEVQINISNPSVSIKFWADSTEVTIGTSTNVNWEVSNAQQVQYNDGNGWKNVDKNSGSRKVSPAYPMTCQLRVTDLDGKTHDRSLTINTKAPPPGIITPAPDS